ncbi:MAG: hypothetical protein JW864_02930 [Spirochaetes bacterium]|nr:hypothetical protein [Spirochaetota bacterium]
MQLLECIVQKPGLIEKTLKFDKSATIIYGKNESGKSLIAKAIIDTLWGQFSGPVLLNGDIWDDFYFEVSFLNSLKRYRFIKDRKECFSINSSETDTAENEKEILRKFYNSDDLNKSGVLSSDLFSEINDSNIINFFKRINIDAFMNVSYLPDSVEIFKNGTINYNIFRKVVLNDSTGFFSLHESLSGSFIEGEAEKNNSLLTEIAELENEFNSIKTRIDVSTLNISRFERIKKEKIRLESELKDLESELGKTRDRKSGLLSVQNNLKKMDEINSAINAKKLEKEIEHQKRNSIMEMEEEIRRQHPRFYNFEESNIKNLKTIQETYREVRDIYEDIGNFYLEQSEKKNKIKNIILFINVVSILLLAGVLVFNYIFFVPFFNEYKFRFIIALLSLSIGSSALFFLFGIINFSSGDLKNKMKKKYSIEKKLEGSLKKNNIILNEYKLETIYEYLAKYFEEYGEYSIKQSELMKMKDAFKENFSGNVLDDELERLKINESLVKEEIDHDLKLLKGINRSELNAENIGRIINEKNRKIIDIKEKIRHTNKIILQINKEENESIKGCDTASLLIERDEILKRLNKLDLYKTSLEFITNNIKEAIIRKEQKEFQRLFAKAAEVFHFLTDNQYKETINDGTIEQMIKGTTGSELLNIPVIHLILLSIKLAVTDFFAELKINLPFILDEPFQNMDENRVSRFKEILDEKSGKRQIVIFTRNNMYRDWGSCIEL